MSRVSAEDDAVWRRVNEIPFRAPFTARECLAVLTKLPALRALDVPVLRLMVDFVPVRYEFVRDLSSGTWHVWDASRLQVVAKPRERRTVLVSYVYDHQPRPLVLVLPVLESRWSRTAIFEQHRIPCILLADVDRPEQAEFVRLVQRFCPRQEWGFAHIIREPGRLGVLVNATDAPGARSVARQEMVKVEVVLEVVQMGVVKMLEFRLHPKTFSLG